MTEVGGDFVPGVYLISSTGRATTLVDENGDGDRSLLREALDDFGVDLSDAVFTDRYECPVDGCDHGVELGDIAHRTRRAYSASTVRCPDHDEAMKRTA